MTQRYLLRARLKVSCRVHRRSVSDRLPIAPFDEWLLVRCSAFAFSNKSFDSWSENVDVPVDAVVQPRLHVLSVFFNKHAIEMLTRDDPVLCTVTLPTYWNPQCIRRSIFVFFQGLIQPVTNWPLGEG